jgi:hypothetical protein
MEKLRVLALALMMLVINLVGISPAQAATFNCGSGGTYTVVSGHITESLNCSGTLTIDSSVTAIDSDAFQQYRFFMTPTFRFVNQNPSITVLVIPSSVLTIGSSAFEGMTTMTSISIANSVTTIGANAFKGNINVTDLSISAGASLIATDTYQGFRYISKLLVPEGVTQIGQGVFVDWYAVTSVTLPSTLTTLGWMPFREMHSLRTINIPANLSTINDPFGYLWDADTAPQYFCSTTGVSNTSSVNDYFAALIAYNTDAGRCSNSFDAPTITSVAFPSSTSATVNFTPPTNFGAGTAIASYSVVAFPGGKRATVSGAAARSVTLSSLTSGTEYTFEVNAINNEGSAITSPPSARSASVTCCEVSTTAPGAPTIGTAVALSPTSASISFTAPTSNGGATITSYTATSIPGSLTGTVNQSGSGSITITGLTASTAYTFRVTATNSVGTSSNSSASASITMPASQAEIAAAALAAQKAAEAKREAEKKSARLGIYNNFIYYNTPTIQLFNIAEFYGVNAKNYYYVTKEIQYLMWKYNKIYSGKDIKTLAYLWNYNNNSVMWNYQTNSLIRDESATALSWNINSTMRIVENVVLKYSIMDSMCQPGKFSQYYAYNLSSVGLIPSKYQTLITYRLRKTPFSQRDDYYKIMGAIQSEIALIQRRDQRLAKVLSWKLKYNKQVGSFLP